MGVNHSKDIQKVTKWSFCAAGYSDKATLVSAFFTLGLVSSILLYQATA